MTLIFSEVFREEFPFIGENVSCICNYTLLHLRVVLLNVLLKTMNGRALVSIRQ